jgi:hypothetical protein
VDVTPIPASVLDHTSLFAAAMVLAFSLGVYGHVVRSRALIIAAIAAIAVISLYFVEVGEVATFGH